MPNVWCFGSLQCLSGRVTCFLFANKSLNLKWINKTEISLNVLMSCIPIGILMLSRCIKPSNTQKEKKKFSSCLSEPQPVYIGVPASHRRKRRRHHSCASDADRAARHTHYEHHSHREHSHREYYHDREEHYEDEEGITGHQEHTDPSGWHLLVFKRWYRFQA